MRVEECSPVVEALSFKRWNPGYGQKKVSEPVTRATEAHPVTRLRNLSNAKVLNAGSTTLDEGDLWNASWRIISFVPSEVEAQGWRFAYPGKASN